ncbi:heparinase II/III family protein [Chitinophaga sp. Cy-1792]|uniref:heparinase II/III domain-containing protein n=1 Tax=Chitinophaga sp. Cy-1792 TaxID=2608339 RepID=UPI00142237CA|nr:heparinase II/III family protein [Chitinophaga sp. Cy-1792]NIG56029.1 heparinase [Chitinophaga sp. Cy-1792]
MKKKLLIFLCCCIGTSAAHSQNLLSGHYSATELAAKIIPRDKWEPFPQRSNRQVWTTIDTALAANTIRAAEGYLHYEWPGIPATTSLLIVRTGNRRDYQDIANKKREVLATLMMAEVYEDKGRFTDDIINGIWSVCEETFWGASAHLPKSKEISGLADAANPFVELFSAETAELLGWVDYFMGDKLDKVSPQIRKRIYDETNRRIFVPLMTKYHGWMGDSGSGRRPNNWNPWISSNWLCATLLLEHDEARRAAAVSKILHTLDQFLNPYPQDGGCDEGPGYWSGAAASLYDNICFLNLATNNAFAYVLKDEKVKHMAQFIYKAQISQDYFLDFADADPRPGMGGSLIYRFGKDVGDPDMMRFGAAYIRDNHSIWRGTYMYYRNLFSLFMQDEFRKAEKGLPLLQNVWWPDLQVMATRDKAGSSQGFYVAAKGGNNDESHNHNDIGNFIVYYDGLPVLVDVGRGTYTARTFSPNRYDIWFNRSDYHNVPTVNGYTQNPGPAYKASAVSCNLTSATGIMKQNIAAAYPPEAGISSWNRSVTLKRGSKVVVEDEVKLQKRDSLTQHLMTCFPSAVTAPGVITIHGEGRDYKLTFPADKLTATIEKVTLTKMEDEGIRQKWGDNIYRINLKAVHPAANEKYTYIVTPGAKTVAAVADKDAPKESHD